MLCPPLAATSIALFMFFCPLTSEKSIKLFSLVFSKAGKIVKNPKQLASYIEKLLSNKEFYEQACKDCETVFNEQQGALDIVIDELKQVINE